MRAIVFPKLNAHSSEIFKKLNVLTVYDINKLQTCCFVYRSMHNLLPMSFCGLFITDSLVHSHVTRQKDQLHVIPHHLNVRRHSIRIYGVKLWNLLSKHLIDSPTYFIFKRRYKSYLLDSL